MENYGLWVSRRTTSPLSEESESQKNMSIFWIAAIVFDLHGNTQGICKMIGPTGAVLETKNAWSFTKETMDVVKFYVPREIKKEDVAFECQMVIVP
jgi:hypothetical protein